MIHTNNYLRREKNYRCGVLLYKMPVDLKVSFLSIALFFSCIFAGCTRKTDAPESAPKGKWFRWAQNEDCSNLESTGFFSQSCLQQELLVMEGLTRTELKSGKFQTVLALADSTVFKSETVLTVKIKKNVLWSNGKTLSSEHFMKSWKRILSTTQSGIYASLFFPIHNARLYFERKVPFSAVGIKALDPLTLELTFDEPEPQFPAVLSHPATFPIFHESLLTPPTFLGEFLVDKHQVGKYVRFLPNPLYYGKPPGIAGIEVFFPQPNEDPVRSRIHLFREGKVDFVDDLTVPTKVDSALGENIEYVPTLTNVYLLFNTFKKPFQLVEPRKAFVTSVDRSEFTNVLHSPHRMTSSFFSLGIDNSNPSWFPRTNIDSAKSETRQLVSRISMGWSPGNLTQELAENLQAQWIKNLDIKVDLVPHTLTQDLQTYLSQQNMVIIESRLNPLARLHGLEQFIGKSAPFNLFSRVAPLPTELLDGLKNENYEARLAAAEEFLIAREYYLFPLLNRSLMTLRKLNVKNIKQNALALWNLNDVIVE